MIPRLLVPNDARLPADADTTTQRRRPTTMDERTLVPSMLPVVPLDGRTSIPANLPLESIATRVVVPRDVNREAYSVVEDISAPVQPTDLDSRIAVPQGAAPLEIAATPVIVPEDLVERDVFMTGEVHLVPEPATEDKSRKELIRRITRISSFAFHIAIVAAILLYAKIFPPHEPTKEEQEIARKQLTLILPPGAFESPKPEVRPTPPAPKVRVDPRVLREVAPPAPPPPKPVPPPERPVRELPSAPIPKTNTPPDVQPDTPVAKADTPKPALRLETPDTPKPQNKLVLPRSTSPNQSIEDSLRASRPSGPRPIMGGGAVSGRGGRPGGPGSTAYGGLEMLTPDEGVDFNGYLMRVYYKVKQNWFAVMPASVELGERGIVVLTFRIMRDGSVPSEDPVINRNSGKEPLDRAAFSSIRASNPFETLPPQFSGPYIELRYTYFYNIDPNSVTQGP